MSQDIRLAPVSHSAFTIQRSPFTQADRSALAACLTEGQLLSTTLEMIPYEIDAGLDRGTPDAVAFPRKAEELEQLMRLSLIHISAL